MFHTPKVVGSHISVLKRLLKRSQVEKKEKGYTNKIYSIAYFINYQRESNVVVDHTTNLIIKAKYDKSQ